MSNRDSELTKSVRAAEAAGTERPQPERMSGILVHPTSFPSPYGIGDLGKGAYDFIDFLKTVRPGSAIPPTRACQPLRGSLTSSARRS